MFIWKICFKIPDVSHDLLQSIKMTQDKVAEMTSIKVITCNIFPIPEIRHEVVTPGQTVFSLFLDFDNWCGSQALNFNSINKPECCRSTSFLLPDPGNLNLWILLHGVSLKKDLSTFVELSCLWATWENGNSNHTFQENIRKR